MRNGFCPEEICGKENDYGTSYQQAVTLCNGGEHAPSPAYIPQVKREKRRKKEYARYTAEKIPVYFQNLIPIYTTRSA